MKASKWIKYWRNSLADADSISIDIAKLESKYKFDHFDLEPGRLPDEVFSLFWPGKALEALEEDQVLEKEILISLISFVPRLNHMKPKTGEEEISPFWISASITSENELKPGKYKLPLIPRKILEPVSYKDIVFSSIDKVDEELAKSEINADDWESYINSQKQLFYQITGQHILKFKEEEFFEVKLQLVIILDDLVKGASYHIIELYNHLTKLDKLNPLLQNMVEENSPGIQKQYNDAEIFARSAEHLGQMNNGFGLSESQRKSLSHFTDMKNGEVLAVNGPPGTGKTTLIQSVIADNFVKAALRGISPKVTVASSTNNQAITNIIDSFLKGNAKTLLEERWLPGITSFALYMVSSDPGKIEKCKEKGWLYHSAKQSSLAAIETVGYVNEAKLTFLNKFQAYSGTTINDLGDARNYFQKKIKACSALLTEGIKKWQTSEYTFMKWKDKVDELKHVSFSASDTNESMMNKLDTLMRYKNFYYAVHYWEAKWIEETAAALKENSNWKNTDTATKARFRRFAMLTPCFVSTFHMLPKMMQFIQYPSKTVGYLGDFIDLLIVDESGQVSPEVGVASFYFARKAMVVGDNYQIEPVWNVDGQSDEGNLIRSKLLVQGDEERTEYLKKCGYMSSNGSLMKLAQKTCGFKYSDHERGLLLIEHRRCLDQIIRYCNELVYDNLLKPLTNSKYEDSDLLPPMGFLRIRGETKRVGGSRCNPVEAEGIVRWLKANEDKIVSFIFKKEQKESKMPEQVIVKPLHDIVGIVTPFAAQKKYLTAALKKYGYSPSKFQYGTVHSLQGAEKDVVLFSPVYTAAIKSGYFFDLGPNMLNVAVSRAKRSFIVAGDFDIFKRIDRKVPSNLLAFHIKDEVAMVL